MMAGWNYPKTISLIESLNYVATIPRRPVPVVPAIPEGCQPVAGASQRSEDLRLSELGQRTLRACQKVKDVARAGV